MRLIISKENALSILASVTITHNCDQDINGIESVTKAIKKDQYCLWVARQPKGWHKAYLVKAGYEKPTNPIYIGKAARLNRVLSGKERKKTDKTIAQKRERKEQSKPYYIKAFENRPNFKAATVIRRSA